MLKVIELTELVHVQVEAVHREHDCRALGEGDYVFSSGGFAGCGRANKANDEWASLFALGRRASERVKVVSSSTEGRADGLGRLTAREGW